MKRYIDGLLAKSFWIIAVLMLAVPALAAQERQAAVRTADAGGHPIRSTPAPAAAAPASSKEYVIGAQDVLSIDVWKEKEISQVEPVRPDGKITLPLVGEIQASGKTPTELQAEIAQKLSAFIQQPAVTVIVQEAKSQRFNIIGNVLRPGSYSLGTQMTVLDALAVAGGFGEFAKVAQIYLVRSRTDGSSMRIRFNYKDAVRGEQRYLDLKLEPGDTIIVP